MPLSALQSDLSRLKSWKEFSLSNSSYYKPDQTLDFLQISGIDEFTKLSLDAHRVIKISYFKPFVFLLWNPPRIMDINPFD